MQLHYKAAPPAPTLVFPDDDQVIDALVWILEILDYAGRDDTGTPVFVLWDCPDEDPVPCTRAALGRLYARLAGGPPDEVVEYLLTSLPTVAVLVERAVDDAVRRALSAPPEQLATVIENAVPYARLTTIAELRVQARDARDAATPPARRAYAWTA